MIGLHGAWQRASSSQRERDHNNQTRRWTHHQTRAITRVPSNRKEHRVITREHSVRSNSKARAPQDVDVQELERPQAAANDAGLLIRSREQARALSTTGQASWKPSGRHEMESSGRKREVKHVRKRSARGQRRKRSSRSMATARTQWPRKYQRERPMQTRSAWATRKRCCRQQGQHERNDDQERQQHNVDSP